MASTEILEHGPAKANRIKDSFLRRLSTEYDVYASRRRRFALVREKALEFLVLLAIVVIFPIAIFIYRDLRRRGELLDGGSLPLWTCSCSRCAAQRLDPFNQVSYWACRIGGVDLEPEETPIWKRRGLPRVLEEMGVKSPPPNAGGAEEWMREYEDG